MGENAIDKGVDLVTIGAGAQLLHTQSVDSRTKYVAFRTTGSTIEPPPSTGTTYRLGVCYYGQTDSELEKSIRFSDESFVSMTDPDANTYYLSQTGPDHINTYDLPPQAYTTTWSGSTAGAQASNGAVTVVTLGDNGLTQQSHIFSNITLSGQPSTTISSGQWNFIIRARVLDDASGHNSIDWNVYKSEIVDRGQENNFWSNNTFLFSGTTGELTTSYVDYNINVTYGSTIVFP